MAPPVFPSLPGITFPVKRSAKWSGLQQDALSGKRVRTSFMTYPIYLFELQFNFLRSAAAYLEWQQLAGFINSMYGGTGLFLFDDPNDDTAIAQSFGAGDGVTTTFQLVRTLGGFTEPVYFPNVITDIKVAGAPTSAYTLSATGQLAPQTRRPGAGRAFRRQS